MFLKKGDNSQLNLYFPVYLWKEISMKIKSVYVHVFWSTIYTIKKQKHIYVDIYVDMLIYVDKRIDKENVANVQSGISHLPVEWNVICSNINVPRISHLHECAIICSTWTNLMFDAIYQLQKVNHSIFHLQLDLEVDLTETKIRIMVIKLWDRWIVG